jgi:hypothetical protein
MHILIESIQGRNKLKDLNKDMRVALKLITKSDVALDRTHLWALVNSVTNLRAPVKGGEHLSS